jgi:hypothetical protein
MTEGRSQIPWFMNSIDAPSDNLIGWIPHPVVLASGCRSQKVHSLHGESHVRA